MQDDLDIRLRDARKRVLRLNEISDMLKHMQIDKERIEKNILKYKASLADASLEVSKLEAKPASFFSSASVKANKRLEMERNNTAVARLRCSRAEKELSELIQSIEDLNTERARLIGAGEEYKDLYEQKKQKLIAGGGDVAQLIFDLSYKIDIARARLKKISEACKACDKAISYLDGSQKKLEKAKDWGVIDIMGGKFVSSSVKHSYIDGAISDANSAKVILSTLPSEDIDPGAKIDIKSTGAGRNIDIFMDNAFIDRAVQGRINGSLGKVSTEKNNLQSKLFKLIVMERQEKKALDEMEAKLDSLIFT